MTVCVKYWPSALNDQPRSTSPASRTTIPAAKATAPGRIAAAGNTRGVRLATTVVAITQARASEPPADSADLGGSLS